MKFIVGHDPEQSSRMFVALNASRGGPGEGTSGHIAPEQRLRGGCLPGDKPPRRRCSIRFKEGEAVKVGWK